MEKEQEWNGIIENGMEMETPELNGDYLNRIKMEWAWNGMDTNGMYEWNGIEMDWISIGMNGREGMEWN